MRSSDNPPGQRKPQRTFFILCCVGFAATFVGVYAIPQVLISEYSRSAFFWRRVAWSELLVVLVWSYVAYGLVVSALGERSRWGLAGATPALGLVVIAYAVISLTLMVAHAFLSSHELLNRLYLTAQIIAAVVGCVAIVFVLASYSSAQSGVTLSGPGRCAPRDLAAMLGREESRLRAGLTEQPPHASVRHALGVVRSLREAVLYSLPARGAPLLTVEYTEISDAVREFVDALAGLTAADDARMGGLAAEGQRLIREVQHFTKRSVV